MAGESHVNVRCITPDEAARAVVQRFWGDRGPSASAGVPHREPIERYMDFRRINNDGWRNIISAYGPDGAQEYREAMRRLGQTLGLED
jgi:hypothetical protein